jgi:transcriptional regulator with XRE-family HTH domain
MNLKKPDSHDKEVGRRIRARRLVCGMSQTALGEQLGVTFQQVQKYEKGTNRVGAGRLRRIAEVLEVPVSFFFDEAGAGRENDGTGMEFLDTAQAVRLMRAYSRIRSPDVQRAIVELVVRIAEDEG